MSPFTFAILLAVVGALCSFIHRRASARRKLPPGPPALPIIGNLHMVGTLPHRDFQKLSKKYGPIMFLRLGSIPTIVVSSPEAAELFLKTHDVVFAGRPKTPVSEVYPYGLKGIAFSEYGPYWRSARKLCTLELLSSVKVDSFADMRREETGLLVELIKAAPPGQAVDVSEMVQRLIEDMTYRMVLGRRSDQSADMRESVHELFEVVGGFSISHYLPLLAPFDQGFRRRFMKIIRTLDRVLERIIDQHEEEASIKKTLHNDFIHMLLSLMNNKSSSNKSDLSYSIDRDSIKAITLDIVAGALDTSSTAIEWIMTELVRHPRVMRKVQEEIKSVVGEDRMVEEYDLNKFEYLEMVIQETIRLHPIGPFLLPHESTEDVVVRNYFIPKRSRILVNSWALGRDPKLWSENAAEFLPERFIGSGIDLRGQHFQLIPFGSGRRGCPGMNLGMKNMRLVVSQLVHCFDWEFPNGITPHELDMMERFGLTLPRDKHLFAVPRYRLHI